MVQIVDTFLRLTLLSIVLMMDAPLVSNGQYCPLQFYFRSGSASHPDPQAINNFSHNYTKIFYFYKILKRLNKFSVFYLRCYDGALLRNVALLLSRSLFFLGFYGSGTQIFSLHIYKYNILFDIERSTKKHLCKILRYIPIYRIYEDIDGNTVITRFFSISGNSSLSTLSLLSNLLSPYQLCQMLCPGPCDPLTLPYNYHRFLTPIQWGLG